MKKLLYLLFISTLFFGCTKAEPISSCIDSQIVGVWKNSDNEIFHFANDGTCSWIAHYSTTLLAPISGTYCCDDGYLSTTVLNTAYGGVITYDISGNTLEVSSVSLNENSGLQYMGSGSYTKQ